MAAIRLRGRRRTYVFDFARTNAMCQAEGLTGLTYRELLAAVQKPRTKTALVLALVGSALVEPADVADAAAIARILRDVGGVAVIRAALGG